MIQDRQAKNPMRDAMDLFDQQIDRAALNLLPCDGEVYYHASVLDKAAADDCYQKLLDEIEWRHDETMMFGRKIVTKRKVAWYADQSFEYRYSGTTKTALPWADVLRQIKNTAERESGESYNACLLNLYHNGGEGMGWHSDAERELKKHGAIASLSFGAERKFSFRHKSSKESLSIMLEHGSMLVMRGETQTHWQHQLPPTKTVIEPRINLTFRTVVPLGR